MLQGALANRWIIVPSRLLQVLPGSCQIPFLSQNSGDIQMGKAKVGLQPDSFQKMHQRFISLAQAG